MPGRRFAAIGLAAVLAAGPLAAVSAAPASAATKPGYVAVVVDGHGSFCVKWKSGITGDAVLNAVASVHYRQPDGLIDAIDNYPSPPHADATHYWSYWHDTSSSWTYSTVGASSYSPKAGSVEGWRFDNGSDPAPAPSANPAGLYAGLCGPHDSASGGSSGAGAGGGATSQQSTPAKRVSAKHTSGTSEHVYHPRAGSGATAGASTSAPSSTPETSGTTSPTASSSTAGRSSAPSSAPVSGTSSRQAPPGYRAVTGSSSAAGAPIAGVDATPAAASSPSSSSSGSVISLLVGIGLVLLLGGGAAFVVARRRAANAGY